jgi:pSer/pThr/pTyr-binding forkhead associated (FHA) protein
VTDDPLHPHGAAPFELRERIAAEQRGHAFLLYRDAQERQVIFDLDDTGERIAIGRRGSNAVALPWDPEVSRVHATLEHAGGDWLISDQGLSHNGTWVNGHRVHGRRRLRGGDLVTVGETVIAFCGSGGGSVANPTRTARQRPLIVEVSPAQRRVLVALCRPLSGGRYVAPASNRQIADELVLAIDTVKGTLSRLFELFEVDGLPQNQKRSALAQRALEGGVVRADEL